MNYLTDLIVRPQRNVYNLKDLGDSAFSFSGQDFKRIDFNNGQVKYFFDFFYLMIKERKFKFDLLQRTSF